MTQIRIVFYSLCDSLGLFIKKKKSLSLPQNHPQVSDNLVAEKIILGISPSETSQIRVGILNFSNWLFLFALWLGVGAV